MGITNRFTLGMTTMLVASPVLASDASVDREAALERIREGAHAERAPAREHGRVSGQEGSVVEVSQTHIVLMTPQGDEKSFELSPITEIRRGPAPVTILEVHPGERAFVRAMLSETGETVATSIRLARKVDSR